MKLVEQSSNRAPHDRQHGVTLIEILVAMVLLAIGVLGLAGLQLRGMQVNQGSMWRSQAVVMAEDLADRLRADPTNAQALTATGGFYGTFTPTTMTSTTGFPPISDWLAMLGTMPGGTLPSTATTSDPLSSALDPSCAGVLPCAVVKPVAGAAIPTPVQISIYWNDARAATGARGANALDRIGSFQLVAEVSSAF